MANLMWACSLWPSFAHIRVVHETIRCLVYHFRLQNGAQECLLLQSLHLWGAQLPNCPYGKMQTWKWSEVAIWDRATAVSARAPQMLSFKPDWKYKWKFEEDYTFSRIIIRSWLFLFDFGDVVYLWYTYLVQHWVAYWCQYKIWVLKQNQFRIIVNWRPQCTFNLDADFINRRAVKKNYSQSLFAPQPTRWPALLLYIHRQGRRQDRTTTRNVILGSIDFSRFHFWAAKCPITKMLKMKNLAEGTLGRGPDSQNILYVWHKKQ